MTEMLQLLLGISRDRVAAIFESIGGLDPETIGSEKKTLCSRDSYLARVKNPNSIAK